MNPYIYSILPKHIQNLSVNNIPVTRSKVQNFDKLITNACSVAGANKTHFLNGKRYSEVINAKRLYCHYLRRYTTMTLHEVARTLGLDHATILHHARTGKDWLDVKDVEYTKQFNEYKSVNSGLLT